MVLEIVQVQGSSGFPLLASHLSHQPLKLDIKASYSKHSINSLFNSSRRTLETLTYLFNLKWFSRLFNYKVPADFHYWPAIYYISRYNLISRRVTVKHSINSLFNSSRKQAHIRNIDIFVLSQMVLEIIQAQVPSGFPLLASHLLHQPV